MRTVDQKRQAEVTGFDLNVHGDIHHGAHNVQTGVVNPEGQQVPGLVRDIDIQVLHAEREGEGERERERDHRKRIS